MRALIAGTVVVVLLSIAGWWFYLYGPARDQQAALQAETTALLAQESQLTNQRQQLLSLQERAPEIRRSLDRLNQFIPPDPDQASFLELLQAAGSASGIEFTSLNFTDPAPVVGAPATADPELVLGSIIVTGSIESNYFQLVDFLRRIEIEVSRAVLVEQVSVQEGEDGFPEVSTTFTAEMFALIAAPIAPVPEGTIPVDPADPAATPSPSPNPTAAVPTAPATDPAQSPTTPEAGASPAENLKRSAPSPGAAPTTTTGPPA